MADAQTTTSDNAYEQAEEAYWQVIYSAPFGWLESGVAVETARAARRAMVDAAWAQQKAEIVTALRVELEQVKARRDVPHIRARYFAVAADMIERGDLG